jgi:uncharacterized protein (TIGR03086 family)
MRHFPDDSSPPVAEDGSVTDTNEIARLVRLGRDREAAELGAATTLGGTAMEPLAQLDQLAPVLVGVMEGLGPDDLDRPTPCASFTVQGVLEHMVGGATMFTAAFRGEASPTVPAGTTALQQIGPALTDLLDAMHQPGALDRTINAPFGEVPGDSFARFIVLDGLVHGWDLAVATGQDYAPSPALVAEVDAFARQAVDPLRDGDTFAAATTPPSGATPIEQLVAFTGRTVGGSRGEGGRASR